MRRAPPHWALAEGERLSRSDRFGHKGGAALRGTEWCPECNGYGSSLMEETERCTRRGGSGLVMVADEREQHPNGVEPRRLGRAE